MRIDEPSGKLEISMSCRLFKVVAVFAASLFGLIASSVTIQAQANLIAFVDNRDGTDHIYLMNPDGTNATRLTSNSFQEEYPSWSPDGTQLVFEGYFNGVGSYIINADGTGQRRLSTAISNDIRPSFSSDGTKIVFSRIESQATEPYPSSILTMDIATGHTSTILDSQGEYNVEARWSPDGTKILWMSNRSGGQHLFTMNPDGTDIEQITTIGSNGDPFWSPDGSRISFGSNLDGKAKLNLFTTDPDGSNVFQVTNYTEPFESGDTSWSPDGTKIIYELDFRGKGQSDPDAFSEVHIINIDGTNDVSTGQRCSSVGCAPRWQPNGNLTFPVSEPSALGILCLSLIWLFGSRAGQFTG